MFFGAGIDIAVGVLFALALSEYIGLTKKAEKAYKWIGAGALSFIVAGTFEAVPFIAAWVTSGANNYGFIAFGTLGMVMILVGALLAIYQILTD